jgi:hypothetical protein
MRQSRAETLAVSGFNFTIAVIIVGMCGMWLATLADQTFHLRWGWDHQILWLAPLIVLFALIIRFAGHIIFRFVGAVSPN